jgi:hypothetical protein
MCLHIILGGDEDLGDESGTRMSRPDGTTEENSPESEEGQPGGVSNFDRTFVKCIRGMSEIENINCNLPC